MNNLSKAIAVFGSSRALAAALGISGEAARKWRRFRVPAERCHAIVRIVNKRQPGTITLSDLRPDLWPPEESRP